MRQAGVPSVPAPTQTVLDPVVTQLNMLVNEQVMAISRLSSMEGDKAAIEKAMTMAAAGERTALQKQLSATIADIDGQKARIDALKAQVAEAQKELPKGVATTAPPVVWLGHAGIFGLNKDEFLSIFVLLLTMPIVAAVTRRLWRRAPVRQRPAVDDERFARLEQAVEAVAIEVERIGESQRFQAKLMADKQPARNAVPRVPTPV